MPQPPPSPPHLPAPRPVPAEEPCSKALWRSSELLGQRQEIRIEHGQVIYRLRRTSQGKLILTK